MPRDALMGVALPRVPLRHGRLLLLALLLPFGGAGCGVFHRAAPQPPAVVLIEPPMLLPNLVAEPPMPPPDTLDPLALDSLDALPAFDLGYVAPRPPLLPRRPEIASRDDDHPDAVPAPPAAPPQLSALNPYQQQNYQRAAQQALNNARRDLQTLYNRRNLDAQSVATRAQADEYVHQAQQALTLGDVVRAQMLAEKAETLARFLLGR